MPDSAANAQPDDQHRDGQSPEAPQAPAAQLAAPERREELAAPPKHAELTAPEKHAELAAPEKHAELAAPKQRQQLAAAPAPSDDQVARGDAATDRFAQLRRTAPTQLPSGPLSPATIIGLAILVLLIVFGLRRRGK